LEEADRYLNGVVGHDSAAWMAAHEQIAAAQAAARHAGGLIATLPRCALPRTSLGFPGDGETIGRSVVSTVCSSASVRRLRAGSRATLTTAIPHLGDYGPTESAAFAAAISQAMAGKIA
jgi:hypothetical protein